MNNSYDPNEENNDSLFSRFEKAVKGALNDNDSGDEDLEEIEEVEEVEETDNGESSSFWNDQEDTSSSNETDESSSDEISEDNSVSTEDSSSVSVDNETNANETTNYDDASSINDSENTLNDEQINSGETSPSPQDEAIKPETMDNSMSDKLNQNLSDDNLQNNENIPSQNLNEELPNGSNLSNNDVNNGIPNGENKLNNNGANKTNPNMSVDNPSYPNNIGKNKGLSAPRTPNKEVPDVKGKNGVKPDASMLLDGAKKAVDVANNAKKATDGEDSKIAKTADKALDAAKTVDKGIKAGKFIMKVAPKAIELLSNPYVWIAIGAVVAIIALIIIALLVLLFTSNLTGLDTDDLNNNLAYTSEICPYVTVTGSEDADVYELEEYVAGVVASEFTGGAEVMKAGAIAARTYFVKHQKNCTVISSQSFQVFHKANVSRGKQYAEATRGMILKDSNGIMSTQYDALAFVKEIGGNVIVVQQSQSIPVSWFSSNGTCNANLNLARKGKMGLNSKGKCIACHGNGMSQCGAAYLADSGYDYKRILKYYYPSGDIYVMGSSNIGNTQYVTNTKSTKILNQSLLSLLPSRGLSVDQMNQTIYSNVRAAGVGTRAGVVAAAATLINYTDQLGYRIPYVNGGGHGWYLDTANSTGYNFANSFGVNPEFGKYGSYPGISVSRVYNYYGMDCSGFVAWAIHNGGFKFKQSTDGNGRGYTEDFCNLGSSSCKYQAGDLLLSPGHVMLIVEDYSGKDTIKVAEAANGDMGILVQDRKKSSNYTVEKMDKFYNNNKLSNYPG